MRVVKNVRTGVETNDLSTASATPRNRGAGVGDDSKAGNFNSIGASEGKIDEKN